MHYQRRRRHGDVQADVAKRTANGDCVRWLRAHADWTGEDCLIWPFPLGGRGRGSTLTERGLRRGYPARFMCAVVHGEAPSLVHQAAHECGKGHLGCVNPRHLNWKTPKENQADRIRHGTHTRGENQVRRKLREVDVRTIRMLAGKVPQNAIARMYGVQDMIISEIIRRKKWAYVA